MNTMLGELAKLNDVLYPRYRLAFKLRKLQQTFMLEHVELAAIQDVLHATGVESLARTDLISVAQLQSVVAELLKILRRKLQGKHTTSPLQEAHSTCLNWILLAFDCERKNRLNAGALKILLCLFCGSKLSDKAKYLFGVLAGNGGSVGREELLFFCESVQAMAACLQEVLYCTSDSADRAISESLYFIRGEEEIEDEEDIGGLQRPWLSQFEFIKVFSASPALNFLSWLELWYFLPSIEKVVHHVKCNVCGVKNITGFRYQCTRCHNYIMCEMCFLKGRMDEPHQLDHQVLECLDYTKSLKSRFSSSKTNPHSKFCRVMNEPCELPISRDNEHFDGVTSRPSDLPMSSSPESTPEHSIHTPTIIRIGSSDSLGRDSAHRHSMSSLGSVESHGSSQIERSHSPNIGETGARKPTPIIPSIRQRSSSSVTRLTSPRISDLKKTKTLPRLHAGDNLRHIVLHKVSSDSCMMKKSMNNEFEDINARLSMEVDTLMQELLPELDETNMTRSVPNQTNQMNLKEEQQEMHDQREKLSGDVASLLAQVKEMHSGFVGLQKGVKPLTEPVNLLDQSSPAHMSSSPMLHVRTVVC